MALPGLNFGDVSVAACGAGLLHFWNIVFINPVRVQAGQNLLASSVLNDSCVAVWKPFRVHSS